jgi:hypothetical protein
MYEALQKVIGGVDWKTTYYSSSCIPFNVQRYYDVRIFF